MFLVAQTQISIIVKAQNYLGSWAEVVHTAVHTEEVPTGNLSCQCSSTKRNPNRPQSFRIS